MEIVPALHVQDGRPVVGRPGAWSPMPTPYPDGGHELKGLVRHLFVRFGNVLVVDLGTGPNLEPDHALIQRLSKQHVELWVDALPASLEDIMDLFVSGASRLTVRMDAVHPEDLLEVLAMAEGEIHLGYPYRSASELKALLAAAPPDRFLAAGAAGLVLIDLARAGRAEGVDASPVAGLKHHGVPVWFVGGVRDAADVDRLAAAGAAGVFVGRALLADVGGWVKIAKARQPADDEEEAIPQTIEAAEGRSLLPGVLPSRPRIPTLEDEEGRA